MKIHDLALPSREQLLRWAPYGGIILLGAILRFWGLGDKPLHHDESLHAYFSLQLMHQMENWVNCLNPRVSCYHYDPLLHGPFQFHAIALVYKISQLLGVYDNGVNTLTVRIAAAILGTAIVGLPYFLRDYLGKIGAWLACFLLAVSPSMVYFSRFAREDIYMAFFTLLLIVAAARYIRSHHVRWLIIAAMAFAFSYATKEATFLSILVFGSFAVGLLVWEIGLNRPLHLPERFQSPALPRFVARIPRTFAPVALLIYIVLAGILAKVLFSWIKSLSIYVSDPKHTGAADAYVQGLKDKTVAIVPWIGIGLGIYVLSILWREMYSKVPPAGRRSLAARINPEKQRLLDTILTMPWTHWFFALLSGWMVFLVLFTVLFTNVRAGIGDGIWQGIYYWLAQQQVARGGQPWYYYFLLIPLYEQIGVVFGLVGFVYCIIRPTRFRLFLAYWFVGNVVLYSWAAEKMPWLMIHMTMPMMLLAAIALQPLVITLVTLVKSRVAHTPPAELTNPLDPIRETTVDTVENLLSHLEDTEASQELVAAGDAVPLPDDSRHSTVLSRSVAVVGVLLAVLLLLPTLHNMYEVAYIHAADGPHEMMVYVQTTPDVNSVMSKVNALDQKLYGGKHRLPIGVMNDAVWPFAWYLRDYPHVCFNFPTGCTTEAKNVPIIITGGDNLYTAQSRYSLSAGYLYHQYHLRTWWDEGYKPSSCTPTKDNDCSSQGGGVGPALWLSYGDTPPPGATFHLGLAAQHIWQWWWQRRAIGDTGGSYDMGLFIRKDLRVSP